MDRPPDTGDLTSHRSEDGLDTLPHENPHPVVACRSDGSVIYLNPAARQLLQELDAERVEALLGDGHATRTQRSFECRKVIERVEVPLGGRTFSWWYRPVPSREQVLVYGVEITQRREVEAQYVHDISHDRLTGLYSTVALHAHLRGLLDSGARRFALVIMDCDRLHLVNASLGYRAGDQLIVEIGDRLSAVLHSDGFVVRLGGDEFAVVIDGVDSTKQLRERLVAVQRALHEPFSVAGSCVYPSLSIGAVLSTTEHSSGEELLRDADTALGRAKGVGGGRIEVFAARMRAWAASVHQLESDLRLAIERDELELFYQPIIDVKEGTATGGEALLRWRRPSGKLAAAGEFIQVAEESDLIFPISNWVLESACQRLELWSMQSSAMHDAVINVNLSARQFLDPDLVGAVARLLRGHRVNPTRLTLEITESTLLSDPVTVGRAIGQLRDLGLRICIDDFGTGYSSLSYLSQFKFDMLKIDRTFVRRIDQDSSKNEIVKAVIGLSNSLGMTVVAEGVERESELEILRQLGCEHVQGFLFARPMVVADFERYYASSALCERSESEGIPEQSVGCVGEG